MSVSISRLGVAAAMVIAAAVPVTMAVPAQATAEACETHLASRGFEGDEVEQACMQGEAGDLEQCWLGLAQLGVGGEIALEACVLAAM